MSASSRAVVGVAQMPEIDGIRGVAAGPVAAVLPSPFARLNTHSVRREDQFEFWRQQFGFAVMEPANRETRLGFDGELLACMGRDGVACQSVRTASVKARHGTTESNVFLLGGIASGEARIADATHTQVFNSMSGLTLLDSDRPAKIETSAEGFEFFYVAIPRHLMAEMVGRRDLLPARSAVITLPQTAVGSLFLSNMQSLVRHGESLTAEQCAIAMDGVTDLGMAVLRGVAGERRDGKGGSALYAAAQAYITRHFARRSLTADHISAALGCSRAQLYRAFSLHEDSVADRLRRVRLQYACALLQQRAGSSVGQIAFDCGYSDPAAFAKAFKRQFGISPSEWNKAASK